MNRLWRNLRGVAGCGFTRRQLFGDGEMPGKQLMRLLLWLLAIAGPLVGLNACGGGSSPANQTNPDFQITATALSPATLPAGGSATSTVTITAVGGFNGTVTLACSGLPSTASCSFNPASVAGSGTSQLTVSTSGTIMPGSYSFSAQGTSGSISHDAPVTLVVQSKNPDFQITATALSPATLPAGGSATSTVTITAVGGFNGTVTLACSGLPSTASCSFNPASVAGSGTSQLTLSTSGTIMPGSYSFSVQGTSGSISHDAPVTLVVQS